MNAVTGKRGRGLCAPSLGAVVLLVLLLAVPAPARADRALAAVFGGAVLLTSLLHAVTYHPPRVVYQTAAPVYYYPQRVVYQPAPVVYYPQPVVYQTVVTRY
ncbi:MAG: hypothetical protein H7836_06305 [Magnetococcus sp. YQC-3]